MTILTSFRERGLRSFLSQGTRFCCLVLILSANYPGESSAQFCNGTVINISGSTTGSWDAPATGGPWNIEITALGAGGGNAASGNLGGGGAQIVGKFVVQNGERIYAISGSAGGSGTGQDEGGGGSGAAVVNCNNPADCANGTFLIIAAGGNGGESEGPGLGGSSTLGGGGNGGAGGGNNGGGGGGGILLGGGDGDGGQGGSGGDQTVTTGIGFGGAGNAATNGGGDGAGGGGGGGRDDQNGSGGGAGHTGADGGNTNSATSFNSGTDQQNTPGGQGVNPANGSVVVVCLGAMPVELINFKAVILDVNVNLIWSTASEKDNHGYDVQRSVDNRNWTTLGFVPGNGTTTHKSEYFYTDESPLAGVNYYRLKQMDTDGSFQHTPIVVADVRTNTLQFDVFPNPSPDGALTFRSVSQTEGAALLEIWDWAGYKVRKETHHLWKGTTVWPVSMTNFPKGAYTARLQMPDGTMQFRKIVLQ